MEIINSEIVISSLLTMDFDKVDSLLFTLVLGRLMILDEDHIFSFEENDFSPAFKEYVSYNGSSCELKEGLFIDNNKRIAAGYTRQMKYSLKTNKYLMCYLNYLDFNEIVQKKLDMLGIRYPEEKIELFSKKEIEIFRKMQEEKAAKVKIPQ